MEIKDNTFARQFETTVAGVLSVEYSFSEKKYFNKNNTPDQFDNEEFVSQL
jgi:hypothetical protein